MGAPTPGRNPGGPYGPGAAALNFTVIWALESVSPTVVTYSSAMVQMLSFAYAYA